MGVQRQKEEAHQAVRNSDAGCVCGIFCLYYVQELYVSDIKWMGDIRLCDDYEPEKLVCITNHYDKDYYSMDDFYDLEELD